ncbi:Vitamin B12 import ATP-binding protein BtuD [Candidatus Izimaplasma bacterium HR1]|jgi:predicted ATPase|uniref:AAA family ATPase n=1 Tax=Candidatus Izimoplasma sp. HR1 TaxID=1541959 RepID=UPI0004F90EEF|nr:Vitamin B12 import ATP-binding protein BtuD [Candidatus Izimaplasma bacterium HR1]
MIKRLYFDDFDDNSYPFNIVPIKNTKELELDNNITIFVGENGSGKSTLLQAIAYYNNSINVSGASIDSHYYEAIQRLSSKMRLVYKVKTRKGFFFSGEEFITYINSLKMMKSQLEKDLIDIKEEFKEKNAYSLQLALGPIKKSLRALEDKYQGELGRKSHGEGFLEFFKARMHQKGIYILDEPETPLSAINQYQLVVLITDLVKNGSQVILTTHSPILMALKGAKIYNFTENSIKEIKYEDIESVQFMKHFLNDKDNFIERL